jgi:uncharacterized membrane protein required for colicin V production
MFDVFVLLYVLVNVFLGIRYGMFRRIIHIAAFYLGMLLAQALSVGFSQLLNYNTGSSPVSAHFLLFVGILFGVVIFAEILGFAYGSALKFFSGLIFDRALGVALAIASAAVELTIVVFLFSQMFATQGPPGTVQLGIITAINDQVKISVSAKQLQKLEPAARFFYAPVLPPVPQTYFNKTYS